MENENGVKGRKKRPPSGSSVDIANVPLSKSGLKRLGVSTSSLRRMLRFQYSKEPYLFPKRSTKVFRAAEGIYEWNNWYCDLSQFGMHTGRHTSFSKSSDDDHGFWPDSPNPKRFKTFCSKDSTFVNSAFPRISSLKIYYTPAVINNLTLYESKECVPLKSMSMPMGSFPERLMRRFYENELDGMDDEDSQCPTIDEEETHFHNKKLDGMDDKDSQCPTIDKEETHFHNKNAIYSTENEKLSRLYSSYLMYPYLALAPAMYYGLVVSTPISNDEESRYVQDQIMMALSSELEALWSRIFDYNVKSIYENSVGENEGRVSVRDDLNRVRSVQNEGAMDFNERFSHWIDVAHSNGEVLNKYEGFPVVNIFPLEIDPVLHSYLVFKVYKFISELLCNLFELAEANRVRDLRLFYDDRIVVDLLMKDTDVPKDLTQVVQQKLDAIYRDEEFQKMWNQLYQIKSSYQ